MLPKKNILGVGITAAANYQILEYIVEKLEKHNEKFYIVTPNPEIIVYAKHNKSFQNILNNAKVSLCDGIGLLLSSLVLGKLIKNRLTGADFVKIFCEVVAEKPITVGFLGAGENVAELTAERLMDWFPGLKVVFAASEWGDEGFKFQQKLETRSSKLEKKIQIPDSRFKLRKNHIDLLFVAYGFPKQEEWISQNLHKLPITAAIGVGGAFDYISGKVYRAPFIVRLAGFEWLWRLIHEPWRFRRQLALLEFVKMVFKARIFGDKY